jgi:hemerythrin-like domain-containing protein
MIDLKKIKDDDPIRRMVEKESGLNELSPMDPPDAFEPPTVDAIPYGELSPFLQKLMDDHKLFASELEKFEKTLIEFKKNGWKLNDENQQEFSKFFELMDNQIVTHHLKEEKILFPLLQKKLIENEEHSKGPFPKTAIDMLEDDHIKITQHLTLMFNFLGLAPRLPDLQSAILTFDVATEQGFALIELLKLHIFREDNVVFPKAQKYITENEFDSMIKQLSAYDQS